MSEAKKVLNYTPEMEKIITESAPLNLEKARELATQLGKSYRSVIAKAKSLGVEYESKKPEPKKERGASKADTIKLIAAALDKPIADFDGLEKATGSALNAVLGAVLANAKVEDVA